MSRTNPTFNSLREHVKSQYSYHVDYTSKTIINGFISVMAEMVRDLIFKELAESGTFYIMIDECKDSNDHEQIAVCVRFSNGGVPKERMVAMVRIKDNFSAQAIVDLITPQIESMMAVAVFIGLCTDGASVMVGKHGGVAALLRKKYPWIINNHCGGHKVNLATGDVVKKDIPKTVNILKNIHTTFNSAKTSDVFESVQKDRLVKTKSKNQNLHTDYCIISISSKILIPNLTIYFQK